MMGSFFYLSRIPEYTAVYIRHLSVHFCHLKVYVNDFISIESGHGHNRSRTGT